MLKLDLIFKKANSKIVSGELEDAYIFIMKYLNVFSFIQKSEDYKRDSKYYKAMLGKQPKEAMDIAESLKITLYDSYQLIKFSETGNKNKQSDSVHIDFKENLPDMRIKKDSKSIVTSAKLFTMLRDGTTKVLIMDIRPKEDFENSRVKTCMMNIPDDIIIKGYDVYYLIFYIL